VKTAVDEWTSAADLTHGRVFRAIDKAGRVWGDGMTAKVLWDVVRAAAAHAGIDKLAPHDLRRTCARLCHLAGGELDQIQFLLGHVSIQTTELLGMQAEAAARGERHDGARIRRRGVTEPGRTSHDRPSLRDFSGVDLQDRQVSRSRLTIAPVTALDLAAAGRAANETCPILRRDEPGRIYRWT
jgi:hypothetical protein